MTKAVEIYTARGCPYCRAAKDLLARTGIVYREIDISGDWENRDAMIARSGEVTAPQIFTGGVHVGGLTALQALDRAGRLDEWKAAR